MSLDLEDERRVVPSNRAPGRFVLAALSWSFSTAICAGGLWAVALIVSAYWLHSEFPLADLRGRSWTWALVLGGGLAIVGELLGAGLGVLRGGDNREAATVILGVGGALFGALGGTSSALIVIVLSSVHPLLSSSLAWAVVGALAGLAGYGYSRALAKPEPVDDDEEDAGPPIRIEWVLREVKRHLLSRKVLSVLPVLLASAGALIASALVAPSEVWLALVAVGVLGLSVALVLYRQEGRLEVLENRFCRRRDS